MWQSGRANLLPSLRPETVYAGTIGVAMVSSLNVAAATDIYTLSLHDALPISGLLAEAKRFRWPVPGYGGPDDLANRLAEPDRKSTRLNSSHSSISYAVFCLKKKMNGYVREPKASRLQEMTRKAS